MSKHKAVERLEELVRKAEAGEPIPARRITRYQTPDGPMHTSEPIFLVKGKPVDIPPNINKMAKRLRAIKAGGYKVADFERVYGRCYEKATEMADDDRCDFVDWLLETFPEVGR